MSIESTLWRLLSRRRFGTLLACLLIPSVAVFAATVREENARALTIGQRLGYAALGGAFGLLAFTALTSREWLLHAIHQRRMRQESVQSLQMLKLALYCVVFPLLFLTILIVVVLVAF